MNQRRSPPEDGLFHLETLFLRHETFLQTVQLLLEILRPLLRRIDLFLGHILMNCFRRGRMLTGTADRTGFSLFQLTCDQAYLLRQETGVELVILLRLLFVEGQPLLCRPHFFFRKEVSRPRSSSCCS